MHGTPHGRVQQRGEPPAMHDAERVVEALLRSPLEDGDSRLDVDGQDVDRVVDRRRRQLAREDRLEHLHARAAKDLSLGLCARSTLARAHARFVRFPLGNHFINFHSSLLSLSTIAYTKIAYTM